MDYITSWISQIILLILMAVVLELLLPNSSMQRYVRMVVGLLLLLALLKPVLSIFDTNPDEMFNKFSESSTVNDSEVKNSIENKKSEIQASNRAYIEEQMAVRLRKEVKKEVSDHFHLAVKDISVKLDKNTNEGKGDNVQQVNVTLSDNDESSDDEVEQVDSVRINTADQQPDEESEKEDDRKQKIRSFLAKKWDLPPGKVNITLEGGEVPDDDQ